MNLVFHFKDKLEKNQPKKMDDGVFINERENEKEKKSSTAKTTGRVNIFAKEISWGI